jgi:hypothetical protein
MFFPAEERMPLDINSKPPPEILRAKQVCFRCPVRKECWEDGMRRGFQLEVRNNLPFERRVYDYTGIRAGMTGKERRNLVHNFGDRAFKFSEERLGWQINAWGTRQEAS